MFSKPLPRFVIPKTLASGATAFYFNVPTLYRKLGCTISNEPLGTDYTVACGENGEAGRAAALNALFDEWNTTAQRWPSQRGRVAAYGTVDWLFREYKQSKAYLEKVAPRSRPDYERTMLLITDIVTKKGDRIGDRRIKSDHARQRRQDLRHHLQGAARSTPAPRREGGGAMSSRLACCASPTPKSIRSRRSESLGGCHQAEAHEGNEGRGHARAGLRVCLGLHRDAGNPKQPQPRSSVLSGSSGRRMSWPVICDGLTTAARNGRTRSRSNTTRPAPSFGIRSRNSHLRARWPSILRLRRC